MLTESVNERIVDRMEQTARRQKESREDNFYVRNRKSGHLNLGMRKNGAKSVNGVYLCGKIKRTTLRIETREKKSPISFSFMAASSTL